jgi:hypothetical protein
MPELSTARAHLKCPCPDGFGQVRRGSLHTMADRTLECTAAPLSGKPAPRARPADDPRRETGCRGFGPARTPLVLDRSCRCGQGIAFRRACNRRAPRSCCRQSVTSALDFAPAVRRIHCASLSLQNSERTGFGTVDVGLARGRQSRQFPQCGESQLDVGHSEWRAVNTIRLSSSRPPPVVTKRSNKDAGRSLGTPGISLRAARCV